MDITEIKKVLSQLYKEKTGLPLYEGSPIMDKLINPLSYLLAPFNEDIETLTNTIDYATASHDTAKRYAQNFFVTIGDGSKSSGDVRIYLTQRQDITIPATTAFFTQEGKQFYPTRDYMFVASQLIEEDGLYRTADIPVEAESVGSEYNVKAGEISGTGLTGYAIYEVTNINDFTGGADIDDNDKIVEIVRDSRNTRLLITRPAITYILEANFDKIYNLYSVGNGDDKMIRDISYYMAGSNIVTESSYWGKVAGDTSNNPNIAYKALGVDMATAINSFTDEFTTTEYSAVSIDNGRAVEYKSGDIFSDDFSRTDADGNPVTKSAIIGNGWKVGETGSELASTNTILSANIRKDGSTYYMVLGGAQTAQGEFTDAEVEAINEELERAGLPAGTFDIAKILKEINIKNIKSSPAVQHSIGSYQGIKINGTFKTTDDGTDDRPFYITVCRNSQATVATAYEGFGLAIMPKKSDDLPNVFIVDNDSVDKDYMIIGDRMINPNAIENFLVAKTVNISPNTLYHYEMRLNAPTANDDRNAVSLDAYIWEDGQNKPSSPTISYGMYVPILARKWGYDGTTLSPTPFDFGYGVGDTQGFEWWFGPVKVTNVSQQYAQMLFTMDVSQLSNDFSIYVSYKGSGGQSGTEKDGAQLYVYNYNTSDWESFDVNDTGSLKTTSVPVSKTNHVQSNKINIMVSSKYPHDVTNLLPIYSSIIVNNIRLYEYTNKVHTGGKIDVYIKHSPDSSYRPYSSTIKTVSSPSIHYLSLDGSFNHPIMRVPKIDILDSSDAVLKTLIESVDYRVVDMAHGTGYSTKEVKGVVFKDSVVFDDKLKLYYDYIPDMASIQSFIEGDDNRVLGEDILAKHKTIYYVDVSITVDDADSDFESALREYIFTVETKLDKSDIVNIAYNHGATHVDMTALTVTVTSRDEYGNKTVQAVNDSFSITNTECMVAENIIITKA